MKNAFGVCGFSLLVVLRFASSSCGSAAGSIAACTFAFGWHGVVGAAKGMLRKVPLIVDSRDGLSACGRGGHGVADDSAPDWCRCQGVRAEVGKQEAWGEAGEQVEGAFDDDCGVGCHAEENFEARWVGIVDGENGSDDENVGVQEHLFDDDSMGLTVDALDDDDLEFVTFDAAVDVG